VSRQLGHATIATTADIYLHDGDEVAAEAAERLGALFEGAAE
jgi:integrase